MSGEAAAGVEAASGPTASDMTSALALPLNVAIGAPVVASTAAMRVCVLPPTVPNVPPRYTVEPFTAIV